MQAVAKKEEKAVGKPLARMEDPKFLTGSGRFVGDIVLPNMLHARFARSTYAHARILGVDVSKAREQSSVRLVLTAAEMEKDVNEIESVERGEEATPTRRQALASGEVNFVGEAVAVVIADDPASAQRGVELISVDYDPLPAVVDPEKALEKGSPKVHSYLKDNLGYRTERSFGNVRKAFGEADYVIKETFEFPRLNAVPLEPRDIVASYDRASGLLTAWVASQSPHEMRNDLASVLNLPQSKVRVVVPDMGGGFGQKGFYAEYASVCYAAMVLGRPVKWVESRTENFLSASQGRGQKQHVEAAVTRDGRIIGLKVKVICDGGAYSDWAISMPETTMQMSPGVYDIGAFYGEAVTAFTNKTPIGAYRGASRPEAAYLIERTLNVIAKELKLDPVKVRLKNYVPKKKFPYRSAGGFTYDSGDYEGNMRAALRFSKYDDMLRYQRVARSRGRLVGVAAITYVEVCGFGSGYPQTASVTVTEEGSVIVTSGTSPHGQGHWTPFAQIVADELGVDPEDVAFRAGDTNSLPFSTVTAGSRSAAVGGSAVLVATRRVKEKMARVASKMLGSGGRKLKFADGKIFVEGSSGKKLTFESVASAAYQPRRLPEGMEASLYEYCAYAPPENVFPFGTHVAMVEVDRETGKVRVLKYVAVDDVGRVLNPLIVEGQVQGGVLQGISQALLEEIVYDDDGQLLTATLADYLIPSTDTAPNVECYRTETPSPVNPLGVKGVGEAGTIAATPAIANAVEDALAPFGATVRKLPLSPSYVWSLMQGGRKSR
jgi:aerobic carbon-monoxide dehydrogenase large subunit